MDAAAHFPGLHLPGGLEALHDAAPMLAAAQAAAAAAPTKLSDA